MPRFAAHLRNPGALGKVAEMLSELRCAVGEGESVGENPAWSEERR